MSVAAQSPERSTWAGEWLIKTWEVEQGLPENSATAMVQSADGYLWFGTFNGLVRFNGVEFTVFNPDNTPQLPSDGIVNLHLDKAERLWVSTYGGLVVGDGLPSPRFKRMEGWPGNYARTFTERANGELLITTFDGKLFEFSNGKLTELPSPPGAKGEGYFGATDEDGNWWAVQNKFIGRWENGQWVAIVPPPPELKEDAVGCAPARDGGMWLLLGNELCKMRRGREVAKVHLPESPGGVWSMSEDSQGNMWIVSPRQGFSRVTPGGEMTRLNAINGGSDQGRFVFEDRERTLWIGTSGDGLLQLTPKRFRHFGLIEGRKGLAVRSVCADASGGVWAATYGRGLFRVGDGGATHSPLLDSADGSAYLQSVLADRAGRLWVGTSGKSAFLVDGTQVRHLPSELVGGSNPIVLFEDSRGRTWISGGGDAVAVFDGKDFRRFGLVGDSRKLAVTCFAEDAAGVIWAANGRSVFRWDREQSVVEVTENGRPIGGIACLKADRDGSMWLGSLDRGLLRWKDGRLSAIGAREGFPVDPLLAVVEDDMGFFWMTSPHNLKRARRSDLQAAEDGIGGLPAWQVFDANDGLPKAEFSRDGQPAGARDERGRLWFATSKGVVMIDPSQLLLNDQPPPVHVEAISFYHPGATATSQGASRLNEAEVQSQVLGTFSNSVILPSGSRRVEIHYAALSLVAPAKVRYQIKLDGQDEEWEHAGNRRVAYYHDLAPRDYVFRVRASNNDGVWNEHGASLSFIVRPFFWQTNWFRLLLASTAVGLVAAGVWGVMRGKLRQHEERLAAQRALRESEERLMHASRLAMMGELTATIAHEVNQPLGAILSNADAAEMLLEGPSPDLDEIRLILSDIRKDDLRASEVIRRIRTLLRKREVQKESLNVNEVISEVLRLVHADAQRRAVAVESSLRSGLPLIDGDRVHLQQVLLNLILNGMDAMTETSAEKRRLVVSTVMTHEGSVEITVKDSGHGIPADKLPRVFDSFFTTKPEGMGLGLAIARSIIEAHGGRIWAENNPDGGATFGFRFPRGPKTVKLTGVDEGCDLPGR